MNDDIFLLAIESSCDETAAAVVKNGRVVLSNVIYSQIESHKMFGGVVPEIASRNHIEKIGFVVSDALSEVNLEFDKLSGVAVTYGPGLVGALLVGLSYAKSLSFAIKKPLIGVNHIEGHICANYIENKNFKPPFIVLIASGGHTHLVYCADYCKYEVVGKTRDDAAGEAFDKIARVLGLGYPGGVQIDNIAKKGDPYKYNFPRVMNLDFDFSFSGLKSSILNFINKCNMKNENYSIEDVAASFQQAIIEVLVSKTIKAAQKYNVTTVALAGGVASNSALRTLMRLACDKEGLNLNIPSPILCTDNAAMIGSAAYFEFINGVRHELNLNAYPNLSLV